MRKICEILRALPIFGGLIDAIFIFAASAKIAFAPRGNESPFLDDEDSLVKAIKVFSAGTIIYILIVEIFLRAYLGHAPRDDLVSAFMREKWVGTLLLCAQYIGVVFSLYYILSLLKWEIINPKELIVLGLYCAGFLLPIRAMSEIAIGFTTLSMLNSALDGNIMPFGSLIFALPFVGASIWIIYNIFYQWIRDFYGISSWVMFGAILTSSILGLSCAAWLLTAIARLPDNIISLVAILT